MSIKLAFTPLSTCLLTWGRLQLYDIRRAWASGIYEYRSMVKSPAFEKSLFGRRLREARLRAEIAQDRLGVMIGLDEGCSSARMSRYENGVHEPPLLTIQLLAKVLRLPAAYFYAEDDNLAELIMRFGKMKSSERKALLGFAETLTNEADTQTPSAHK